MARLERALGSLRGMRVLILGLAFRPLVKEHTCSPAILTSGGLSIVVTVGGIYVRDAKDPKALWVSPMGFAPRNCGNPAVAGGRLFINPQDNGMVYCFEPDEGK